MNCVHCGKNPFVTKAEQEQAKAKEIKFSHNGQLIKAQALPYSDAFYKIVAGKYKDNLVHRFDIAK